MRIDVRWLSEEKRVIHINFHSGWDWQDFDEHRKRAKALAHEVPYLVNVIMEFDKDASMLPINALRNLGLAAETAAPQLGKVVIVSPSQYWRVVIVLLKRLLPESAMKNTYIVHSRDDALRLLNQAAQDSEVYE